MVKRTVYIMRGLQGSGKSTLAKKIAAKYKDSVICCADDFFYILGDGKYLWQYKYMKGAHEWCFKKFVKAISNNTTCIVIDNTNTRWSHFREYIEYTINYNYYMNHNIYKIKIIEPKTWWKWNVNELWKRNSHKVPIETIKRKKKEWQIIIYQKVHKLKYHYNIFDPQWMPKRLATLIQRIFNLIN